MDSDRLNRWLTLGANLGVIAGILFLAYEIRQNSAALEAESRYSHSMLRSNFFSSLSSDAVIPPILMKAQGGTELDAEEKFRLRNFYMQMFVNWQWEWGEHRLGRIQAPIDAWRRLMLMESNQAIARYPGLRSTWEANKYGFTPDFINFMDNELLTSNGR